MINLANFRNFMLPVDRIAQALPRSGIIYEIGCGYGSLSYILAQSSPQRRIVGIDSDNNKINIANQKFKLSNLEYVNGDALTFNYSQCQGVVLSDFLHHIDPVEQIDILKKISSQVMKKGVVVIKEINKRDGIRRLFSRLWDFILYPEDKITYLDCDELLQKMEKLHFSVTFSREVKWFPGSTHLFICKKN